MQVLKKIKGLVHVKGNESLALICSPAELLVLSEGCYLGALINLSSVWATRALSEAVLPVKDPWLEGLHLPQFDLSLVLLLQSRYSISPWVHYFLSLTHSFALNVVAGLFGLKKKKLKRVRVTASLLTFNRLMSNSIHYFFVFFCPCLVFSCCFCI